MSGDFASHAVYRPRLLRRRSTKAEMEERRAGVLAIVAEQRPMTVRQVFYQATVSGLIEKTERGYDRIKAVLGAMRREDELPYSWIADNTRWMRKPRTYNDPEEAINEAVRFYRKRLWSETDTYVEIWLEKDALAGVIYDVTDAYDVPLMVSRGYASLSFLHSAAEAMEEQDRPCYVYHLGDFDPSGVNAGEVIERTLRELAPAAEIVFERIAVTPAQIAAWNLPTRPTKTTDTRAARWGGGTESVELDAIEPNALRDLVRERIEDHLPAEEFERLKRIEEAERGTMLDFLAAWEDAR